MVAKLDQSGPVRHILQMSPVPNLFDPHRRQLKLARARQFGDWPGFLQRAMLEIIAERVGFVAQRFEQALLLGDIADTDWPQLATRHTHGTLADQLSETLSYPPESFDLLVSLGQLHVTNDVPGMLLQFRQLLKPDGLLLACFPGGDTLHELRHALVQAESQTTGGAALRVHPMIDVRDGGNLLQRAGFAMPVADIDKLTVTYARPLDVLLDVRRLGETSVLGGDRPPPLTRKILAAFTTIYDSLYRTDAGRVQASYTVVALSGWSPADSQPKPKQRGSATMRLADALRTTGQPP
jgi:SAM-dependent methyltransferase